MACLTGSFAIIERDATPLVLGPFARGRRESATARTLFGYPSTASFASAGSATAASCRAADGISQAALTDVTLVGDVEAATLVLEGGAAAVSGLEVGGIATAPPAAGSRLSLGSWGYLTAGETLSEAGGIELRLGLAVHLATAHDGLAAGAIIAAGFTTTSSAPSTSKTTTATPAPKHPAAHPATHPATHPAAHTPQGSSRARQATRPHRRVRSRKPKHATASHGPLKVTPPLALKHYTFPIAGPSDFVDTYGGFRADVSGNWHHGDDLFAPLGTPVVAVADGTLNRVGWEKLGGWRLWVRDSAGDEFYYAHLSGYTPAALHSTRVRAGEVIGYVGNTGDAFTTSPHVHFEIHPRQLLHLAYDGAVDPTRYLDGWTHIVRHRDPVAVHPPLPSDGQARHEAQVNFRELLDAHHVARRSKVAKAAAAASRPTTVPTAPTARAAAPAAAAGVLAHRTHTSDAWLFIALAGAGAIAVTGAAFAWRRRERAEASA